MNYPVNPREIIEQHIGKDAEIFARWAWGENFETMPIYGDAPVEIWNKLHGDKLNIDRESRPIDDIPKMIELWKKETSCQIKY